MSDIDPVWMLALFVFALYILFVCVVLWVMDRLRAIRPAKPAPEPEPDDLGPDCDETDTWLDDQPAECLSYAEVLRRFDHIRDNNTWESYL